MIDFRYHLVSIIAIFVALSVGIVLGTTLLEEPTLQATEAVASALGDENGKLRAQNEVLLDTKTGQESFVAAHTPELVRGSLAGETVVIVEAPAVAAGMTDAVRQVLEQAGATVTAQVTLADKYLDPAQSVLIDRLATGIKPADLVFPAEDGPYDKAAAVLASALVTVAPDQAGKENPAAGGVIDAFQRAELLTVTAGGSAETEHIARAGTAVVITPADPYAGENAATQAGALVSLALGLDEGSRGTVLAGPASSATTGGVVTALREGAAAEKVSGVDTADMPAGRVVVVYALREQLSGNTGQYGIGPGAPAFEPSPPSPEATLSPSPEATPSPPSTATSGG
ncbi:hypothetical protein GCM10010156_15130 [Planobispora rosea]|uniref:Copper transporter n=1 Tax=Planobispora rosea TaxID=35762 RepID=A0A8J3WCZ8_PLARO|nr:copper transporter [Planobispora rosea]GGS57399.1 hypothetical protein GCM10010156_15130 [Planobispora rosea]GIH83416.1 hypothetical protein Pro02_18240 [Planobispora rosea]